MRTLERGGYDEYHHRNHMRRSENKRAVRREEHDPRDEGANERGPDPDADSSEQACKQDRRQEGHRSEAFANPPEEPAEKRGEDEESAACRESKPGAVAWQLAKCG